MTDANFGNLDAYSTVGFQNYAEVLQDRDWWTAVRKTLIFTLASVSIETVLDLAIALLLNQAIAGRGMLRAAILIPWAIPVVVSAKIWEWMLHDQNGVINYLLEQLGLIDRGVAWLAEPSLALAVIVAVDVWITTPFMVLLILAGLQMIPKEVTEAAIVDGVSPWRRFTGITLPLMGPALASPGLLAFIAAWNEFLFALTFILTDNNRTIPVAIGLISAASRFEYPFGPIMAASVIVTLPLIVLVLIFQRKIVAGLTAGAVKG